MQRLSVPKMSQHQIWQYQHQLAPEGMLANVYVHKEMPAGAVIKGNPMVIADCAMAV